LDTETESALIDKPHMNCTELHCITVYRAVLYCAVRASRDVLDECLSSMRSVARAVLLPGPTVGRYWVLDRASSECQGEKRGDAR
jgi:hypothetical protein